MDKLELGKRIVAALNDLGRPMSWEECMSLFTYPEQHFIARDFRAIGQQLGYRRINRRDPDNPKGFTLTVELITQESESPVTEGGA